MDEFNQKVSWRVKEIAQLTGLKEPFIRKEIRLGHLKAIRRGKCVLVLSDDLREYLSMEGK